jgi:hypothetical protein
MYVNDRVEMKGIGSAYDPPAIFAGPLFLPVQLRLGECPGYHFQLLFNVPSTFRRSKRNLNVHLIVRYL